MGRIIPISTPVGVGSDDGLRHIVHNHARTRLFAIAFDGRSTVVYPLPMRGQVVIGSDPDVSFTIDAPSLSSRHAILQVDGEVTIQDAGSKNGTWLGTHALPPREWCRLRIGERVVLGSVSLIVLAGSAGQRETETLWSNEAFQARLEYECARAQRASRSVSVVQFRAAGQLAMSDASSVIANALGPEHPVMVVGEDTHAVLIVGAQADAEAVIDRLASKLAATSTTLRHGIASCPRDGFSGQALLAHARSLLDGGVHTSVHPGHRPELPVMVEPAMLGLHALAEKVAATNLSVLLLGETGAGKEILAAAIHRASPRREAPLLRLNCAAFTESLLENELFGHEKGAFSGATQAKPGLLEIADGGTAFLDEVGELPLALQAKLLRVLENGEIMRLGGLKPRHVDVRFISATNRDLLEESQRGRFRADLFYRLSGFSLVIPPLRDRPADIEALARHFVDQFAVVHGRSDVPGLSTAAIAHLRGHHWPGNVRELRNVIGRALVVCGGAPEIGVEHLEVDARAPVPASRRVLPGAATPERDQIIAALERCAGNQTAAARMLGISRGTLVARLNLYGLPRPRKPGPRRRRRATTSRPG